MLLSSHPDRKLTRYELDQASTAESCKLLKRNGFAAICGLRREGGISLAREVSARLMLSPEQTNLEKLR